MNASAGFVLLEYIMMLFVRFFKDFQSYLNKKTAPAKVEAVVTHSGKIISSRTGEHGVRL